jgi:hypothetical protein
VEALQIYQSDPVAFCRDVLGMDPWERQVEILEAVRDEARVTVRAWTCRTRKATGARS